MSTLCHFLALGPENVPVRCICRGNRTRAFGATTTFSPVRGLRPTRPFAITTSKTPKPRSSMLRGRLADRAYACPKRPVLTAKTH